MVLERSEQDLTRQAQEGSAEAFEALIERHRERLKGQIQARMGPAVRAQLEADDLLQDTFAKAFESIRHFQWRGEDSFYRWLGSIAEHLIWNASKRRGCEPLRLEPRAPGDGSVSKRLRRAERFERLKKALANLSPDLREALILSRLDGLGLKEVAQRMGRSPGAIQKLVARALLALKRSFGDTESLRLPDRSLRGEESAGDG
jgi:RNA polymerase sigma-70 factor (ECF subfamily)